MDLQVWNTIFAQRMDYPEHNSKTPSHLEDKSRKCIHRIRIIVKDILNSNPFGTLNVAEFQNMSDSNIIRELKLIANYTLKDSTRDNIAARAILVILFAIEAWIWSGRYSALEEIKKTILRNLSKWKIDWCGMHRPSKLTTSNICWCIIPPLIIGGCFSYMIFKLLR